MTTIDLGDLNLGEPMEGAPTGGHQKVAQVRTAARPPPAAPDGGG
jgi:hypothetical protein